MSIELLYNLLLTIGGILLFVSIVFFILSEECQDMFGRKDKDRK